MSQISPEVDYQNVSTVMKFVLEQFSKTFHTAIPGIVENYSSDVRRAQIRPALKLLLSDGTSLSRPPIVDVPVLWPSGGGMNIIFPLEQGDAVMLIFSERGIGQFKGMFSETLPDVVGLFSETDAVAVPGFGALGISPVDSGAACWQDNGGRNYIALRPGQVEIETTGDVNIKGARGVEIKSPLVTIRGSVAIYGDVDVYGDDDGGVGNLNINANTNVSGSLKNNQINVGSTHRHGGVDTGAGKTQGPE